MAVVFVLGQRARAGDKLFVRGVFSQRKKLWEAVEGLSPPGSLERMEVMDDVTGSRRPATYPALCKVIAGVGRVTLLDGGHREFLVVAGEMNEVRPWDVDESGVPVNNPPR